MTDARSRAASLARIGAFRPPEDPRASWAGQVRVARAGETWPLAGGEPMLALVQLNLTEAPVLPPALEGLALVTMFVAPRELTHWALRAYESLDGLVELEAPQRPFGAQPIRWEPECDYADHPLGGLKPGGFPVDDVDWGGSVEDVDFEFQVAGDDHYGAVLYVGRSQGVWVLDW